MHFLLVRTFCFPTEEQSQKVDETTGIAEKDVVQIEHAEDTENYRCQLETRSEKFGIGRCQEIFLDGEQPMKFPYEFPFEPLEQSL